MRYALAIISVLFAPNWALAAGQLPYGSRVGMNVTITSLSDIGTTRSLIKVKHTRENAREFCVEYSDDTSTKCIEDTIRDTRLNDEIRADCKSGIFTTLYGERLAFKGKLKVRSKFDPVYIINGPRGKLDGSSASGYIEALSQFQALCPALVTKIE